MVPNRTVITWKSYLGSCDVTEVTDEKVRGTFSFTGTNDEDNSTKIVIGKFYAPRQ